MFAYIASDPEVLNGKPHIIGTRLGVEFVIELFTNGATKDDVIEAYPQLTAESFDEILKYAKEFQKIIEHVLDKNSELYRKLS